MKDHQWLYISFKIILKRYNLSNASVFKRYNSLNASLQLLYIENDFENKIYTSNIFYILSHHLHAHNSFNLILSDWLIILINIYFLKLYTTSNQEIIGRAYQLTYQCWIKEHIEVKLLYFPIPWSPIRLLRRKSPIRLSRQKSCSVAQAV